MSALEYATDFDQAIIMRGGATNAGEGAFDGWRTDLYDKLGLDHVLAPGDNYWPYVDDYKAREALIEAISGAQRALVIAHSYGGNITYQSLRADKSLSHRVGAIVHMASPLKMPINFMFSVPEPSPEIEAPVVGFSGSYDGTVPLAMTGSRIDSVHHVLDCGHHDFVANRDVRAFVIEALQAAMKDRKIAA